MRVLVLSLLVACGGKSLPPPPPYTPVDSPEPATRCPDQRAAAKQAREDHLEKGTSETRGAVARAVFAQAECERDSFDDVAIDAPAQAQMIENLRAARQQYLASRNLYLEVGNYQALDWTVGAFSRQGDLEADFADRLRAARPPGDIADSQDRAAFLTQLGNFAQTYDAQAVTAWREALRTAALLPSLADSDRRVAAWVDAACAGLRRLGATPGTESAICNR